MRDIAKIWDWLPPIIKLPLKFIFFLVLVTIAIFFPIALVRKWHWLYRKMWEWDVY